MKKLVSVILLITVGLVILIDAAPPRLPVKADKVKEVPKEDVTNIEKTKIDVGVDKSVQLDSKMAHDQQNMDQHKTDQRNMDQHKTDQQNTDHQEPEENYDDTFQFLRDQPDLINKFKGLDDDVIGRDLANPAFRDLDEKMLDRFDDQEYDQVRHQRDLEHQIQEANEREEHPESFRLHHSDDNRYTMEELNEKLQEANKKLRETDDVRHKAFLRYELEKELLRKKELEKMNPDQKKVAEDNYAKHLQDMQDHPKLHHPGSKEQLQEVWEKEDGFQNQEFNPDAFFRLHDTNGDGHLDNVELEAVLRKEVSKLVGNHKDAYDERELKEELQRMRQHVSTEIDVNKDGLVSLDEFIKSTKKAEFKKDEGWETFNEDKDFERMTPEELERYERKVRDAARNQFDKIKIRTGEETDPRR